MDFVWKTTLPSWETELCESPIFSRPKWQARFRLEAFDKDMEHWDLGLIIKGPTGCYGSIQYNLGISIYLENKAGELKLLFCEKVRGDVGRRKGRILQLTKSNLDCNDLITDGKVSLHFGFDLINSSDFFQEESKEDIQPVRPSIQTTCHQNFSEDIEALFDSVEHSDVLLECGDRRFSLNKTILSARSEVFAAMFRSKMTESSSGIITVADIQPAIMEQFFRYVYSGRVDSLCMDSVFDLYKAGDKYAVPALKRKCASFLVDKLANDKVCEILLLAHTFGDTELLNIAVSFAAGRAEFLKSKEWNTFAEEHPNVAVKVLLKCHVK